jgi:hypothetical protein
MSARGRDRITSTTLRGPTTPGRHRGYLDHRARGPSPARGPVLVIRGSRRAAPGRLFREA